MSHKHDKSPYKARPGYFRYRRKGYYFRITNANFKVTRGIKALQQQQQQQYCGTGKLRKHFFSLIGEQ